MFNYSEINALIAECLSGNATEEQVSQLEEWVNGTSENRLYYLRMKNLWDFTHIESGLRELDSEKALSGLQRKLNRKFRITLFTGFMQKAAAVLFLPLLITSFFLWRTGRHDTVAHKGNIVFNEVSAAFGTRSVITLSDGSRVWLNSGSKLKYPHIFMGNSREVFLTGEGYFEVESDGSAPFIVRTRNLSVRATGTSFNVNASSFEKTNRVTLVNGKITVCKNVPGGSTVEISQMQPNQHLAFDTLSGRYEVRAEDPYKYIAWKDGKLIFRNDPLEDVITKIGYFYNVDIELRDEKLKEYRYRATFEEESIYEILNLLKLSSPVDYIEIRREPLPDGSFPRKKIIIFQAGGRPSS